MKALYKVGTTGVEKIISSSQSWLQADKKDIQFLSFRPKGLSMGLCRLDYLSLSTVHCLHRLLLWYWSILLRLSKGSPVQASRTTSTLMRGKSRDIPCGSPLEDDQVVRRCLVDDLCVLFETPWCVKLVFIALFGLRLSGVHPMWFWCSCVCPLVEYRKLDPFPCLLQAWFESGYLLVYWEMTSRNCLRIPVNLRSLFEEVYTFPT